MRYETKMKKTELTSMIACAFMASIGWGNDTAPNRMTDILKPVFQRQEQDLLRLADKWMADGMKYEIKEERRAIVLSKSQGKVATLQWSIVTVPPEIVQELRRINLITRKSYEGCNRMLGFVKKHEPPVAFPFQSM